MNKPRELTEKQALFTKCYYTPGSDTFGNGRESARSANYRGSDGYLDMQASRLIRNDKVIAMSERIKAELSAKMERTVESLDLMHQAAYDLAMNIKQPSAAVSAGTAIARLYGMDKDAGAVKEDQPLPLTKEELATLKREAIAIRNTAKDTA